MAELERAEREREGPGWSSAYRADGSSFAVRSSSVAMPPRRWPRATSLPAEVRRLFDDHVIVDIVADRDRYVILGCVEGRPLIAVLADDELDDATVLVSVYGAGRGPRVDNGADLNARCRVTAGRNRDEPGTATTTASWCADRSTTTTSNTTRTPSPVCSWSPASRLTCAPPATSTGSMTRPASPCPSCTRAEPPVSGRGPHRLSWGRRPRRLTRRFNAPALPGSAQLRCSGDRFGSLSQPEGSDASLGSIGRCRATRAGTPI